jgi:lysine 6-dehydrogenase
MKVLVLGGAGIVGRAITKDLVAQTDVEQVMIGDLNVSKAERYLQLLNSTKASVEKLDVSDHERLVAVMRDFDVIANCVYYDTIIPVTKAAIEAKTHIVDLGGFFYGTQKQMEMDGAAREAGITLLHGCGSGPGLTNVLCRYGAEKLDRVHEIHIRAGGVAPSPDSPPVKGAGMTIRTVLDEFTTNPVVFEDMEYKKMPCISGKEVIEFPAPIGPQPTYFSLHSEPLTLSKYIEGVRKVHLKVVFPDEEIEAISPLIRMGLTSVEPLEYQGRPIVPRHFLDRILVAQEQEEEEQGSEFCATVLWLIGQKGRTAVKLTYEFMIEHEKRWGNTKTGVPFSIGVLMVGRGDIAKRGFTVPEEAVNPVKFIEQLKERGFVFKEREEYLRAL